MHLPLVASALLVLVIAGLAVHGMAPPHLPASFVAASAESQETKEQCEPGKSYRILLDKKTGGPSVADTGIKDIRFPRGVVWYQDLKTKQWEPLPCETSMAATQREALQKVRTPHKAAAEEDLELKSLIDAHKKGEVIEIAPRPSGVTSKDLITTPEALKEADASFERERSAALTEIDRLITSPKWELSPKLPWRDVDPELYLAQKKLESDEWRAQFLVDRNSTLYDQPPRPDLERAFQESQNVPLPRERPSALQKLWNDPVGATTDFIQWFQGSGKELDITEAFGVPSGLGVPPTAKPYTPDFSTTFSDMEAAPLGDLTAESLLEYGTRSREPKESDEPVSGIDVTKDLLSNCNPSSADFLTCSDNYARSVTRAAGPSRASTQSEQTLRTLSPTPAPTRKTPDAYTSLKKDPIIGPLVDPSIKAWNWFKSFF